MSAFCLLIILSFNFTYIFISFFILLFIINIALLNYQDIIILSLLNLQIVYIFQFVKNCRNQLETNLRFQQFSLVYLSFRHLFGNLVTQYPLLSSNKLKVKTDVNKTIRSTFRLHIRYLISTHGELQLFVVESKKTFCHFFDRLFYSLLDFVRFMYSRFQQKLQDLRSSPESE